MNETASIRRAKHPVIAGVCMAAAFAVSLVVCLWALELTSIPFLKQLDDLSIRAYDDQCTGANPRYPLVSEIREIYLAAYYGK